MQTPANPEPPGSPPVLWPRKARLALIAAVLLWLVPMLVVSCTRQSSTHSDQQTNGIPPIDWEKVDKDNAERLRHPHPSDWHFPNFETGPGRPLPILVNFYGMDDRYPDYLLCAYDVEEKHYSETNEPVWLQAAIQQIRRSGPKKFPPIKWAAIMIVNRADGLDQRCKVGAIFNARDVFDPSRDLPQLVAQAKLDRHPFLFDQSQATPGEQQRWVIVERHAAANPPAPGSN